jgi:hypothetical protein
VPEIEGRSQGRENRERREIEERRQREKRRDRECVCVCVRSTVSLLGCSQWWKHSVRNLVCVWRRVSV